MYLFFDTETNGLPNNWNAPVTDLSNWPRLVQIAWLLCDDVGAQVARNDHIVKPVGFNIPIEATSVHGITYERAMLQGKDLGLVLKEFNDQVRRAKCLVAHNMSFDENIVGAEFLRKKMVNPLPPKPKICTMVETTDFVGVPGLYGNKWPKLSELHQKVFGFGFQEEHNAVADIEATAKCFWALRRMKVL